MITDSKSLYNKLLIQLSKEFQSYVPEYERFINCSLELSCCLPYRILNTKQDYQQTKVSLDDYYLNLNSLENVLNDIATIKNQLTKENNYCFELPTSDAVVIDVYKQFTCVEEYRSIYLKYLKPLDIPPHITLGFINDAMVDEMNTIDFIAGNHQPKKLIFSVYTPINQNISANDSLMPLERAAAVFMYAKKRMPNTTLILDDIRPTGIYRNNLDILAYMHGVRNIVNPSSILENILL